MNNEFKIGDSVIIDLPESMYHGLEAVIVGFDNMKNSNILYYVDNGIFKLGVLGKFLRRR